MADLNNNEIKISIIGAGSWGTTIAKVIAENYPYLIIKIWAYEKSVVKSINESRENNLYLKGIKLPLNIKATGSINEAVQNSHVILFATPSKVIYDISTKIGKHLSDKVYIGYLTKGFCKIESEVMTISEALSISIPEHRDRIAAIYGPSHAEEVSRRCHTCLNVAGNTVDTCEMFKRLLSCDYLECRISDDIKGVELGGTLKNPIAIAAGMMSILPKCGDNLTGVLISEAFKEILKIGRAYNVKDDTLIDISGLGDLITTALSDHSRNRRFGKDIARQILKTGRSIKFLDRIIIRFKPQSIFEKMSERLNYLAEGAYAIEPIIEIAKKRRISIPVFNSLYEILLNKKSTDLLIKTVKNPDNFQEIYHKTKIHVKRRKKGLEKINGTIFKKLIINNATEKFIEDEELKKQLFKFKKILLSHHEKRRDKNKESNNLYVQQEISLFRELSDDNIKRTLEKLNDLYLNVLSDRFTNFFYNIFVFIIKIFNLKNVIFNKNLPKGFFENNIKVSGRFENIYKISETSNLVYISTHKSFFDFIFLNFAIKRSSLHIPRYFTYQSITNNKYIQMIYRLCGCYFINPYKFINPVYRELIKFYLSTLVGHGVPILFFPEISISRSGEIKDINREFLSGLIETIFKNTEEIALLPIEISYHKRPYGLFSGEKIDEVPFRKLLNNIVRINFSEPILVSEFTKKNRTISFMAEMINYRWKLDTFIFPHYIFCGILKENNYTFQLEYSKQIVKEFIQINNIDTIYKPKIIVEKGIKFIKENGIGTINGKNIIIFNKQEVNYYSNLLNL